MEDRPKTEVWRLLWDGELDGPAPNPWTPHYYYRHTDSTHTHGSKHKMSYKQQQQQQKTWFLYDWMLFVYCTTITPVYVYIYIQRGIYLCRARFKAVWYRNNKKRLLLYTNLFKGNLTQNLNTRCKTCRKSGKVNISRPTAQQPNTQYIYIYNCFCCIFKLCI